MADQKYCGNCGGLNPPDAEFCANCGKAFVRAAASPPYAAPSAASMPGEQQPQYSQSPEPTIFGFSRKMVLIGVVALFVILTLGCVAVAMTSPSTPTPTAQATVAATATVKATATPTVKATATPKPTATSTPDYSSTLNSNTGWLGQGYQISTPFKKTTVNGREAYVGSLTKTGFTMPVQIFPMSSYSDAVSYREQLINNYKAQGYTTSKITDDGWQGTLGYSMVDISALSSTVIDQPVTMVISTNIA